MSLPGSGCCCGIIAGLSLSLCLGVVGTVAFYFWKNPEARQNTVNMIEKNWDNLKTLTDLGGKLVESAKEVEITPPPEPALDIKMQ